ncbi:MAG: hypothetical protein JNM75_04695 [Rhodospirillales bacterium]|nr:hypothetical protein [Rhodospirillales bacterium]
MSGRVLPTPWLEFVRWCRARGLRPLPAHPWTIAAYARWCEHRHRYPTIAARIRAIARIHLLKCASFPERHPTVQRTLTLIEARDRGRADRSDLFDPDTAGDERPAEGAKRRRREPVAEAAPADAPRQRRRRPGVALRATPRLVSRRPRAR